MENKKEVVFKITENQENIENLNKINLNKIFVTKIFELNPKLAEIGTPEDFLNYTSDIFPESKIKNIVWHGTPKGKIKEFDEDEQGISRAFFFSDSLEHANKMANWKNGEPTIHGVVLNIQNPLEESVTPSLYPKETKPEMIERARESGYDSLILDTKDLGIKIMEYIVLKPNQVHILGTEVDEVQFSNYMKQK